MVSGAVAGDDVECVAAAASDALGCAIAIAIPALGEPVVRPADSLTADQVAELRRYAAAAVAAGTGGNADPQAPGVIADSVLVRIGTRTVGIVAAAPAAGRSSATSELRSWLDAAAAAASVTALIRSTREDAFGDSQALLEQLASGRPQNLTAFLDRARRLGFELGAGAVAICARPRGGESGVHADGLCVEPGTLLAEMGSGRILGLAPIGSEVALAIAETMRSHGMTVAVSAPRHDPAALHEAIHEAELLVELGIEADTDETFRLLIGVLLRAPGELATLRARTISPLAEYDAQHDTDLVDTLQTFLTHDGSTTETAETMNLHRHTVGYRLSRVHEVSGRSPYASEGRELLSLGLKAHQILAAEDRLRSSETP